MKPLFCSNFEETTHYNEQTIGTDNLGKNNNFFFLEIPKKKKIINRIMLGPTVFKEKKKKLPDEVSFKNLSKFTCLYIKKQKKSWFQR